MSQTPYLLSRESVLRASEHAVLMHDPSRRELVVLERDSNGGVDSPMINASCKFVPVRMAREFLHETGIFLLEPGDWTVLPYTKCGGVEIQTTDFVGAWCRWE